MFCPKAKFGTRRSADAWLKILELTRESAATCIIGLARCIAACLLTIATASASLAQTAPYLDSNGWTVFTASPDTRIIYVSSSTGNDSNDGRSRTTPVKTIKKGLSLLRHNYPDWLLLKRGDVWTDEAFGYISGVTNGTARSGRSATEPMLFSSYGSGERPLIQTNPALHGVAIGSMGGGGGQGGNFVAFVGLEFYAYTRDPNARAYDASTITNPHYATSFLNPFDWILIEDCKFSFYRGGLMFQPGAVSKKLTVRRNIITHSYSTNSHAQGLFSEGLGITDALFEENLFDHNGWNEQIAGADSTIFNHNLYLQGGVYPSIVRHNIIARASSVGVQGRSGGDAIGNLFIGNPIAGFMASSDKQVGPSRWNDNVVLHGRSPGWGPHLHVGAHSGEMHNNIVAHYAEADNAAFGYQVGYRTGPANNVTVQNNILYKWPTSSPLLISGGSTGIVEFGNMFDPAGINMHGFVDPERAIASYAASLGGPATTEHFLAEAAKQNKPYWRPEYTAKAVNEYIRAGFSP